MKFSNWKKPTRLEELSILTFLKLNNPDLFKRFVYVVVHSFKQNSNKLIANVEYKFYNDKPKFIKVEI